MSVLGDAGFETKPIKALLIGGVGEVGDLSLSMGIEWAQWEIVGVTPDLDSGFHMALSRHPDVVIAAWTPRAIRLLRAIDLLRTTAFNPWTILVVGSEWDANDLLCAHVRDWSMMDRADLGTERIAALLFQAQRNRAARIRKAALETA
jgi:hypothetical protein